MQEAGSRKLKQPPPDPLFQQPVTKKMTQQFTQDVFTHITPPRTMAYVSDCIPFFIFSPLLYYIIFTLKIRQMDCNLRKQECPERIFLLVCELPLNTEVREGWKKEPYCSGWVGEDFNKQGNLYLEEE